MKRAPNPGRFSTCCTTTPSNPEHRLADLLVLLYAQGVTASSRLTVDHIQVTTAEVHLHLGRVPIRLPEPGRPISTQQLTQRLNTLGIRPSHARSTALFQLATEIPAAILARTLSIHTDVAVTWQRHAAGNWTTYAADLSRRNGT